MAKFRPLFLMCWLIASCCLTSLTALGEETETAQSDKNTEWAESIWQSLQRQTGQIKIDKAQATLNVGTEFYFLNAADAEKILTEVWGNPPGQTVLGMIFPADKTPFDKNAWAVTISYDEDGYVSDKDAAQINYSELLTSMQEDAQAGNEERQKQGFEPIKLIGWAAPPFYDAKQHKLHWAKEIQFGDDPLHTLNYNIRVLGRKGVLVLNFIADIEQLPAIESQLNGVLAMAEFDKGASYDEFDPKLDKIAAYGLGALVAGKLIAKTGLIAAALLFLKKIGVFLVVAIGALWRKFTSKKTKF